MKHQTSVFSNRSWVHLTVKGPKNSSLNSNFGSGAPYTLISYNSCNSMFPYYIFFYGYYLSLLFFQLLVEQWLSLSARGVVYNAGMGYCWIIKKEKLCSSWRGGTICTIAGITLKSSLPNKGTIYKDITYLRVQPPLAPRIHNKLSLFPTCDCIGLLGQHKTNL